MDERGQPVNARTNRVNGPFLFTCHPRRITQLAIIAAVVVLIGAVVVGILLQNSDAGVVFTVGDQIGIIGLGLLYAGGVLLMARPRLRIDSSGLWVRNILGENHYEWKLVERVAFPEGSNWAQLMLPDDETHAIMAIQAIDKQRAVAALQTVRELVARYAPPPPVRPPEYEQRLLAAELDRPLGRLEIIDRQKAAKNQPSDPA